MLKILVANLDNQVLKDFIGICPDSLWNFSEESQRGQLVKMVIGEVRDDEF